MMQSMDRIDSKSKQLGDLIVEEGSVEPESYYASRTGDEIDPALSLWAIEDQSLDLNAENGSTAFLTLLRTNATIFEETGELSPLRENIVDKSGHVSEGSPFSMWYVEL